MDAFVQEFHTKILPSRRKYDFAILGPWVTTDNLQFVWIATYDGALEWEEAVDRYYHSPERSQLEFDPDEFIESMDVRMLENA